MPAEKHVIVVSVASVANGFLSYALFLHNPFLGMLWAVSVYWLAFMQGVIYGRHNDAR